MTADELKLYNCNESELLSIIKKDGHGHLRRGLPVDTLVKIITGQMEVTDEHRSGTVETRARLQKFIQERIDVTRSQLPGCDGMCMTYPCSDGRHALCFGVNKDTVR